MGWFKSIENFFKKIFTNAPQWNAVALGTLSLVAPLFETIVSLINPTLAGEIQPIITEVQADLGTLSQLFKQGQGSQAVAFLENIKANLPVLVQEAHITDPATQTKVTNAVNALVAELESILVIIPAQAPTTA